MMESLRCTAFFKYILLSKFKAFSTKCHQESKKKTFKRALGDVGILLLGSVVRNVHVNGNGFSVIEVH